jgi:alkylation response protein AidB-like acyl-CoA dehydrogenase
MNFDYNEEQRLLAESVRRFVAQDYAFERRREIVASPQGWSPRAWSGMADLGLLGLSVSPDYGGFGGGAVDLMSTMEAIGDALVVEPYLSTVGLGARLLTLAGTDLQKESLLPAIVEGKLRLAFAQTEALARYDLARVALSARKSGSGYVLDGEKRVVLHAPCADKLIVSARTSGAVTDREGISLFVVDAASAGIVMKPYRTLDEMRAADVGFKGVTVGAEALLGEEGRALTIIEEAIDFATALVCAEAVGAIRFANDTTLEYLKTRRQFGVPIGSFQALQHRIVDMAISYEQARSMASLVCARVDSEKSAVERRRIVSAAKVRIADACRHVSQESVQLHGGMGMSEELKVSHTFRRLTMIAQQFGDADHHLERFAAP